MEFRLTYEGPLPATQRNEVGSVRSLKLQRKHDIRRYRRTQRFQRFDHRGKRGPD